MTIVKDTSKKGIKDERRPLKNGKHARMFWSKTKGSYQNLSNFSSLPITVPVSSTLDAVPYPFSLVSGQVFPTAEHLFHAMKYGYTDIVPEKGLTLDMYVRHLLSDSDPKHAKRTGSRSFFVKHHMNLRVNDWLSAQEEIQRWICRWKRQQHHSSINPLLDVPDILVHYESCRSGKPENLIWGAQIKEDEIVGGNRLGCLWMECGKEFM